MSGIPGVVGFFTADEVPMSERKNGKWLNGFASTIAYDRVRAGYACGNCLAKFAIFMAVCPVCHARRDVAADLLPTPPEWQSYWDEHNYGTGDGKGGATVTRTVDEALGSIASSPDVEQIPLSKLKKKRR